MNQWRRGGTEYHKEVLFTWQIKKGKRNEYGIKMEIAWLLSLNLASPDAKLVIVNINECESTNKSKETNEIRAEWTAKNPQHRVPDKRRRQAAVCCSPSLRPITCNHQMIKQKKTLDINIKKRKGKRNTIKGVIKNEFFQRNFCKSK